MEIKVTRIYTGTDGESHFEDIKMPLTDFDGFFAKTENMKAATFCFCDLYNDELNEWHTTPNRQFVITLEGEIEVGVWDGTKRRFKAGDILLAEDKTGRGHTRKKVSRQDHKIVMIVLD